MADFNVKLIIDIQSQERFVQIDGDMEINFTRVDLSLGLDVFRNISMRNIEDNRIAEDGEQKNSIGTSSMDDQPLIKFSNCMIKITPERNLIDPSMNNEKIMYPQAMMDEFGFILFESNDLVNISG